MWLCVLQNFYEKHDLILDVGDFDINICRLPIFNSNNMEINNFALILMCIITINEAKRCRIFNNLLILLVK